MIRLLNRIRNWSMATKQFLLLFIVTLAIFVFLAATNYQQTAKLFKEQIISDAQTLMNRTNQFLDSYLDNGQNILLLLSSRTDLVQSAEEKEITDFLRSVAETNSSILKTLYIIRSDGKVFSSSQVFYEVLGNPALPEIYEQSKLNYTAMVSEPYWSPQSGRTVAIARPMVDQHNERIGVAVVELDLEKLSRRMVDISSANQTFALISGKQEMVLYDANNGLLPMIRTVYPAELPDSFIEEIADLPYGSGEYMGPEGLLVTLKSGQNRLGWTLILFMKESYFYQSLRGLYDSYKAAGMIMLVMLLVMAYVMSKFFTRPIRLLALRMDRVRDMTVVPNVQTRRNDEIGRLARSFHAMMDRIQSLLKETREMEQRKKELELKVLQSQIAPHFLYNTLACIGSLARQQRSQEMTATIRALVGVLKFTFDRTSEYVRVEEEIEGLHQYMQIQKVRYGNKIQFQCLMTDEALSMTILKLTLQPIVENCIFHGILPKGSEGGQIVIRGEVRKGRLRLVIRDNGVGMELDLYKSLSSGRQHPLPRERFTGIGMSNVYERIRLYYGPPFGLRVRSLKNKGTVTVITLPARSSGEDRVGLNSSSKQQL